MARRKNDGIVGRILLWFVGAFVIIGTVAGIKFVIEKDFGGSEEPSQIVPIPSETPPTSDGGATSDEPVTSEEPEPTDYLESVAVKGPFEKVDWLSHILNFETEINITPLVQTTYRNSDYHGKLQRGNREYIFNSAKMGKTYEGQKLGLQLGFPTTLNDTHDEKFGLSELTKKYTSYLIFDYKVKNDTGFEIRTDDSMLYNKEELLEFSNADIHLIYKTNESPNWNYVDLGSGEVIIPADDLFYQFAIVLNTGNKQNNVVIGYFDLISIEPPEQPLDPQPEGLIRIQSAEPFIDEYAFKQGVIVDEYFSRTDSNGYEPKIINGYYYIDFIPEQGHHSQEASVGHPNQNNWFNTIFYATNTTNS